MVVSVGEAVEVAVVLRYLCAASVPLLGFPLLAVLCPLPSLVLSAEATAEMGKFEALLARTEHGSVPGALGRTKRLNLNE